MNDEFEISLVVPHDEAALYADALDHVSNDISTSKFSDYYLSPECRIRVFDGEQPSIVTLKKGNKASGHRKEKEELITIKNPFWLEEVAGLIVRKTRSEWKSSSINDVKFSIDVVESPMKVGIFEIETDNKEIAKKIFKVAEPAVDCPFNAWDYFKRRIAFIGGPSSGKTSTAKAISLDLNNNYDANTSDVVEYATSFIQKSGHPPTFEDQPWIQLKQKEREEAVASTANMVLSDCPPFLAYIYAAKALRDGVQPSRFADYTMQSLYKRAVKSLSDYKLFVLLKTLDYKENSVRFHDKEQSVEIYEDIKRFISNHGRSKDIMHTDYRNKKEMIDNILYMNNFDIALEVMSTVEEQ